MHGTQELNPVTLKQSRGGSGHRGGRSFNRAILKVKVDPLTTLVLNLLSILLRTAAKARAKWQ